MNVEDVIQISNNIYDQLENAFVKILKGQFNGLPVVESSEIVNGKIPSYPYIVFNTINDHIPIAFKDFDDQPFKVEYQFKAVSDLKNEARGMADYLRRVFFLRTPHYNLSKLGVGVEKADAMPVIDNYFDISWQHEAGTTVTFVVKPHFEDETQNGILEKVNFKNNKE